MSVTAYTDREQAIVRKFASGYFWMRIVRRYFKELFENNDRRNRPAMKKAAHFFNDLATIMIDHFLLLAAKVMDPAESFGHENLSVYYLVQRIAWPADVANKLSICVDRMQPFNDHIREARNKILSHNNLDTILNEEVLGAFPDGMDSDFMAALGEVVELTHRTCVGAPFNPVETFPGDALDFNKILGEAEALDSYMADHPEKRTEIVAKYILGWNGHG